MCLSASRQSSQGSGLAWDLLLHWAVIRAPRATSARRNHSCRASLVRTTAELNYSPILDGNWRNEDLLRETLKKYKVVGKKEEWILVFVVMPSWTLNEDDNDLHATCFLSTVAHWSENINRNWLQEFPTVDDAWLVSHRSISQTVFSHEFLQVHEFFMVSFCWPVW